MWTDKVLGLGICCGLASTVFLFMSLFTDDWYIVDASAYRKQCRIDVILEKMYPWDDEEPPATDNPVSANGDRRSSIKTTTQVQLTLGDQTISPLDKPYNDWPGMPLLSNKRPNPESLRMTKRRKNITRGGIIDKPEENNGSFYVKVARWNGIIKKIQSNLRGFGGRDTTFDRRNSNLPTGEKADCTNVAQKSIEVS